MACLEWFFSFSHVWISGNQDKPFACAYFGDVMPIADTLSDVCHSALGLTIPMTFLMHWSFKTGYHEIAAKKFLATGAPFPECKSWKRFHGPGSVEGWILVEADNADACYEHAAEWAECLDWSVTPVLMDEQAGPLIAKAYS